MPLPLRPAPQPFAVTLSPLASRPKRYRGTRLFRRRAGDEKRAAKKRLKTTPAAHGER